jgi:hypothetical protein
VCDANGDGRARKADSTVVDAAMGSRPGEPNWDPRADVNGDGIVEELDRRVIDISRTDLDGDGTVNLSDLKLLVANWNRSIN